MPSERSMIGETADQMARGTGIRHLLSEGFERSTAWAHTATALFVFASDFLKPILPHCTLGLLIVATAVLVALVVAIRRHKVPQGLGAAVVVFCLLTAVLSFAMLGLQRAVGDENGAAAGLVPAIERLQERLGVIETKLDAVKQDTEALRQGQQEEAARAETRQQELRQLVTDAAGGGAAAVRAITAIRDLLRPGNPQIDTILAEQLPALVQRILADLQKPAASVDAFSDTVKHVLTEAQAQSSALQFADAAKTLDAALERATADDRERARGRAALLAERGRVSSLQFNYRESAGLYAKAAEAVAFDPAAAWWNAKAGAEMLYLQGDSFGDNAALNEAIGAYQAALKLAPREQSPQFWAATEDGLGNALRSLGERESGTARLDQAIVAFDAALQEYTREKAPLNWARVKSHVGDTLVRIGERTGAVPVLQASVAAYRDALLEMPRERFPLDWARTQTTIGIALGMLGAKETGSERLQQAVDAHRASLLEYTQEHEPLSWAAAENNLGNNLRVLGQREGDAARIEEAVKAYHAALLVYTRDRVPLNWAHSQHGLAEALAALADLRHDPARMAEALTCMRNAAAMYRQTGDLYWLPFADKRIGEIEVKLKAMQH